MSDRGHVSACPTPTRSMCPMDDATRYEPVTVSSGTDSTGEPFVAMDVHLIPADYVHMTPRKARQVASALMDAARAAEMEAARQHAAADREQAIANYQAIAHLQAARLNEELHTRGLLKPGEAFTWTDD